MRAWAVRSVCWTLTVALVGCGGQSEDEGSRSSSGKGKTPSTSAPNQDAGSANDDSPSQNGDSDVGNEPTPPDDPSEPSGSVTTNEPVPSNTGTTEPAKPVEGLPTGACLSSGWCWTARSYFGDIIYAGAVGIEDASMFLASRSGHVLQQVGDHFVYHEKISELELRHIVVINDHDVWAGGWHYDGEQWEQVTTKAVTGLAFAHEKIWAALDGNLYVWEDDGWVESSLVTPEQWAITDLLASEDGQSLWAVDFPRAGRDSPANVYRYQGDDWETLGQTPPGIYHPELVLLAGQLHVRGSEVWNVDDNFSSWGIGNVYTAFGTDAEHVYYTTVDGLFRFNGVQGENVSWKGANAVWPAADGRVWLGAHDGNAYPFDPQTNSVEFLPPSKDVYAFDEVPTAVWADGYMAWGASEKDVWRARTSEEGGDYQRPVEHFDGDSWNVMIPNLQINDIHGCSADNVWIAPSATDSLYRWDGETLLDAQLPTEFIRTAYSVRCLAEDDVWIAGGTWEDTVVVIHFDGESWSSTYTHPYSPSRTALLPYLDVPEPGKLWLSTNSDIHYYDGSTWRQEFTTAQNIPTPLVSTSDALWLFTIREMSLWQDGSLQSVDRLPMRPNGAQLHGSRLWIWGTDHGMVKQL